MIGAWLGALETVFGWLLGASWQASVLVVLVLLLQLALRGRLNPRWYHALWLLVIARLLLPFLPESALSLFQFAPSPPPVITETVTEPIFNAPDAPTVVGLTAAPAPSAAYPFSVFTVLALIWFTGAVGLFVLTWQVNRRFARHVGAAPPLTDPHLLRLAEAAQRELELHRRLRLIESAQVQSPAIMGLFSTTLILPREVRARFDDDELRFIFLHEFAHLKRGDLFLQWLIALLQILHWFNPVLWYAFRRMRADREPATDALVLSRTGEEQKEPYGQVLVKLLEHYHQRHSLPTLVGILEDKDQFKRRFSLIARFTRGAYGWSLLGVLIIGILSVACLTRSKATESPVLQSLVTSTSTVSTVVSKPNIEIGFTLVQIDEKTYHQQTTAIDEAVKNGNVSFLRNLTGISVLSWNRITTQVGLKAGISIGKELIQGDQATPVATLAATPVLAANGKVISTVVKNQSVGPTEMLLGVKFEVTPLISKDGTILLPIRYRIGYVPDYKSPSDFDIRTTTTDKKLNVVDGQASGFWVSEQYATDSKIYPYSLISIMGCPGGQQIKTLPQLSPSPNRLVLIVTARRVLYNASATPSPHSELTPQSSAAAQSQAQTWLQVDYCETAEPNTMGTNGLLTDEQAHSMIFNPTNKITSPKLDYIPLTIGTNAVSFQKPAELNWTVTVDWKDPHTTNAQAVKVNVKWPQASGGNVSYGVEFNTVLQPPYTCFWIVPPWNRMANSSIFVHFVDAPSGQLPKATGTPATTSTTDASPSTNNPLYQAAGGDAMTAEATGKNPAVMTRVATKILQLDEDDYQAHRSAIDAAAQKGDTATLQRLLDQGLDPDASGSNPVYWAVYYHQAAILQILLDHDAGANWTGPNNEDAEQLATRIHPDLLPILRQGIERNRPAHIARLTAQLNAIHIDLPAFSSASLHQVIATVMDQAKKSDSFGKGFLIGVLDTPETASSNITLPPQTGVSISDALKAITEAAKLQFHIEDLNFVQISPLNWGAGTLIVKTLTVPAGFFNETAGLKVDVKQELADRGIAVHTNAQEVYVPEKHSLVVYDTPEQIEKIASLLTAQAPQGPATPSTRSELTPQPAAAKDAQPAPEKAEAEEPSGSENDDSSLSAKVPINHALDKELLACANNAATDKVGKGDADKIASLLAQGADPNAKEQNGTTALAWTLNFGKDEAAKLLIRYGADGSVVDSYGENAAWLAAKIYYCPGALKLLIKKGVNVTGLDKVGGSIFSALTSAGPAKPGKMNYLHDRIWTDAEYQAYEERERRTVDLLIAAGVDFSGKDGAETPLMRFIQTGHFEAARALIRHSPNLAIKDKDGHTVLEITREAYADRVDSDPAKKELKSVLDMFEAATKDAPKSNTSTQPETPFQNATVSNLTTNLNLAVRIDSPPKGSIMAPLRNTIPSVGSPSQLRLQNPISIIYRSRER